ncbi:MAG: ABC transporter permease subunit, partial [Anaerolineae bacterium]|nr:ABC transporter permease subunit [Anaerolineae bacterium]
QPAATTATESRWQSIRTSNRWQKGIRHALSYLVLSLGAIFMLIPMLWMIIASVKPAWQIFTDPPIWVPQQWEEVRAGSTNRFINLWQVEVDGQPQKVIQLGTRRYTTVIDSARLHNLQSVPADQLSGAEATLVGDALLNVRVWAAETGTKQVIALARDGDNLIVVDVADLQDAALRLPLDEVNGGGRADPTVEGVDFRGREITDERGATLQVIPVGPESELTIVGSPEIAREAALVPAEQLSDAGFTTVGETELKLWQVGEDANQPVIVLAQESWQPILDETVLDEHAFVAPRDQLGDRVTQPVQDIAMQVAAFTPTQGDPYNVVILISGTSESLVMPVDQAQTLRLAELGGLVGARGDSVGRIAFRVMDSFDDGSDTSAVSSVALVGDSREMALVAPQTAVDSAFDVPPDQLQRAMHVELTFDGYTEALQTKVADTYFPTFFRNSFVLVVLNIIGHVWSCIVVAYAFARLRAPGRNVLFLVLLSTMMLPFPVTLVPVYEFFTRLNMVNTLWPLFIRSFFGNAFLIFMLRQFFSSIPRELEDAARIDGANVLQIIRHVIVPLSKPAIATVIIFTFWWTWNSFLEPFIYLSSPDLFPVSVGLNFFQDQYATIYYDRLIAASVMSMVPMIVIFFFAQRYFIEGIQLTGMKG